MEEDQPDWLGRHGGWILVIFGAALVAVAVVFRKEQAVASILSFSGVAAVIFGVLLSRLEGSFEFGPTKFAATLRAVRSAGIRDDLTLEEKANLILGVVDVRGDDFQETIAARQEESRTGLRAPRDRQAEAGLQDVPLPRPIPFVVTGATDQVHMVGLAFEEHVKRNLAIDGWVIDTPGGPDVGVDFRASKDAWLLHVQVKLARRWGVADASKFVERLPSRQLGPTERYVLAVNSGALSFGSRSFLVAHAIVVWEVPVEGW